MMKGAQSSQHPMSKVTGHNRRKPPTLTCQNRLRVMFTGTLISYSLASSLKRNLNVTHGGKTKEMSGEFWMEKGKVRTLATANYETLGGLRGH